MDSNSATPNRKFWTIAVIFVVACVVALGVGLGFGLYSLNRSTTTTTTCHTSDAWSSSSRLTKDSPIYVIPSNIKEGFYRFASVASDAPICSSYGTEMMARHGGSAMDAAIAAILCNCVFNPQSCGVGGGHFITYYRRSEKKGYAINAREMAPSQAHELMFTDGTSSQEGGKSIAVPGEVKGLYEAWKLGGRLPWEVLFRPEIQMCTEGLPVGYYQDFEIKRNAEAINRNPELKKVLTNTLNGELLKKGDMRVMPKLAQTLEKIANDPFSFYNGSLAADIVQDISDAGGIITFEDLKSYKATVQSPLMLNITGGYTVISAPLPSSGPAVLLILNILNGFKLNADSIASKEGVVDVLHRITEAFKHCFAIRSALGDPDQERNIFKHRIAELLSNMTSLEWGESRRAKITRTTYDAAYYEPSFDSNVERGGTTHISVLGPDGDAVSITSSINIYFGSKIVGTRSGIFFNDHMDDFSTPNTTNFFGIPASPANFIKPFKRPLSSMAPTIVLDADGDVILVTGATGGSRITTSVALSIIETIWLKLGLKESIELPRIHHQLLPPELRIEKAMPEILQKRLKDRGHTLNVQNKLGSSIQAILRRNKHEDNVENMFNKKKKGFFSYCDPSREGAPDGF